MTKNTPPLNLLFILLFALFLIVISIINNCPKSNKFDINEYKKEHIVNTEEAYIDNIAEENSYSVTIYYIKQQTYAGTCQECFNEIFDYCKVDDRKALQIIESEGRMKILYKGQKVHLLDAGITYAVVREEGSTEKMWVVNEHMQKDK